MTENMIKKNTYLRFALAAALAVGFSLPLCSAAHADWRDDCHDRLRHDKERIDRDAARYGEHSEKVAHDVDRLERTRQWCRDHHADWDHSQFDVGIYVHPH